MSLEKLKIITERVKDLKVKKTHALMDLEKLRIIIKKIKNLKIKKIVNSIQSRKELVEFMILNDNFKRGNRNLKLDVDFYTISAYKDPKCVFVIIDTVKNEKSTLGNIQEEFDKNYDNIIVKSPLRHGLGNEFLICYK